MKNIVVILFLCVVSCDRSHRSSNSIETDSTWNQQKREQYLTNRNDSSTWDIKMLETDKQMIGIGDFGPFEIGVFPVPKYDLLGKDSFKGLGSKGENYQIGDKTVIMNSFFVADNEINKKRLNGKNNEVFFQLLVLTDTLDTINYNLNKNIGISRNHPDYVAQGFVKTKENRIDYFAFDTAESNSYAIINTRLFDLNFGNTILIAPQKDGTLRSLQIKSPQLTSETVDEYTNVLLQEERVKIFFTNTSNI
ncbi:hypothetical protein [Gaetbulibacter jejuensis]|uniref:hypothetical protein n=1 Tax=Gaetbulibacter jejuensis TaxID=584607 RepID=UPI003008281C